MSQWEVCDGAGPVVVEVSDDRYRVRMDGKVRKTFTGETAHADAARLASDLYFDWRLTR